MGVEAKMKPGHGGIFTVAVGDAVVARKTFSGFPDNEEIVRAVAKALQAQALEAQPAPPTPAS